MWCRTLLCCGVLLVMGAIAASSADAADTATAKSPSELLEKAIYTEETVGNLEAAVKLYEETVAEAKKVDAVAAKAQYRLGQCLLNRARKRRYRGPEESLRQFPPGERTRGGCPKTLAAAARPETPAGLLGRRRNAPFHCPVGRRTGTRHGHLLRRIGPTRRQEDLAIPFAAVRRRKAVASRVDADFDTLQPIDSTWRIALAGEKSAAMSLARGGPSKVAGKETMETLPLTRSSTIMKKARSCSAACRSPTSMRPRCPFLLRWAGPIDVGFEVKDKETVEAPAGEFPSLKVLLPMPIDQAFWFSADKHRYITKIEAGGVVMPLSEVENFKPGEAKPYRNADLGFR